MGTLSKGKEFLKRHFREPLMNFYWRMYGRRVRNPLMVSAPRSLLFICLGNLCRSPFAEQIARRIFSEMNIDGIRVNSAGIEVFNALQPPEFAIQAARRFDVRMETHRSAEISEDLVSGTDMILVMETNHLFLLREQYPDKRDAMFLLPLFDGTLGTGHGSYHRYNISDPYGQDQETFIACYERIAVCVRTLAEAVSGKNCRM